MKRGPLILISKMKSEIRAVMLNLVSSLLNVVHKIWGFFRTVRLCIVYQQQVFCMVFGCIYVASVTLPFIHLWSLQTDDMFGLEHLVASNFFMLSKNKKNAILLSLGDDESLTFLLKHQVLRVSPLRGHVLLSKHSVGPFSLDCYPD